MGKRAKEHRKKVQIRNQKIATERKKFQKLYSEMLTKKLEELQEKYSATKFLMITTGFLLEKPKEGRIETRAFAKLLASIQT